MKNKVKIISCYFGKLPVTYELWADSCGKNPEFDFLLVTDQDIISQYTNIKILKISFAELQKLIKEKVIKDANIPKAYKLCDFKPTYGLVFADYLKGYAFWGHCDIDMIFGDIGAFINDDILAKYDRILYLGHLSLYRNTEKINTLCLKCDLDWHTILTSATNYGFDEDQGLYKEFINKGMSVYSKRIFFDIYPFKEHMELDNKINKRMENPKDINYREQMFVWYEGKVYRCFQLNNEIQWEEAIYIHMGKNQIQKCIRMPQYNTMFFSKDCIITTKVTDKRQIGTRELMKKFNHYSLSKSIKGQLRYWYQKIKVRLRRELKQ